MMGKLGTGNIEIGNNSTLTTPAGAAALVAAVWRAAILAAPVGQASRNRCAIGRSGESPQCP